MSDNNNILTEEIAIAYWGAVYKITYHPEGSTMTYRISTETIYRISNCVGNDNRDKRQLLLLPLYRITDEDALICATIANPSIGGDREAKIRAGKSLVTDYWNNRVSNVLASTWVRIIDFLRASSWNGKAKQAYDCGHRDICSLITAGIAIEKE